MKRILVAGVGNIFFGDDGFGCEVIRQLASEGLPPGVMAKDFGIRTYDLAYALAEKYDSVIFADAMPRGETPGTVSLLELNIKDLAQIGTAQFDAHSMDLC